MLRTMRLLTRTKSSKMFHKAEGVATFVIAGMLNACRWGRQSYAALPETIACNSSAQAPPRIELASTDNVCGGDYAGADRPEQREVLLRGYSGLCGKHR